MGDPPKWPIGTLQLLWRSDPETVSGSSELGDFLERLCASASLVALKAFNEIPNIEPVDRFFLFFVTLSSKCPQSLQNKRQSHAN